MKWKKYWGVIPLGIYLVLQLSILTIGSLTESSLRSVPEMVLFWFGVLSGLTFIFWMGSMIFRWRHIRNFRGYSVLKIIFLMAFIFLLMGTMYFGMFVSTFRYEPEHIVERNGIRMVASVNSFLQKMVYYYEYKNLLFHGTEQIGWEDYGNGSGDPLERGEEPNRWYFEDLDGNMIEKGGEY